MAFGYDNTILNIFEPDAGGVFSMVHTTDHYLEVKWAFCGIKTQHKHDMPHRSRFMVERECRLCGLVFTRRIP